MAYMAIDQYGNTEHELTHPRRDLLERMGRKHADKMYVDTKSGDIRHVGYVIGGRWWSVYRVEPMHAQ